MPTIGHRRFCCFDRMTSCDGDFASPRLLLDKSHEMVYNKDDSDFVVQSITF